MHSLHNTRRAQTHREATVCYSSDCKSECDVNICWSGCDRLRVRWTSTDDSIKLNTNTNGGGSSNRRNNNATAFTLRETHTRSFVRSFVQSFFMFLIVVVAAQRGNVITFFQLEVFAQQVFSQRILIGIFKCIHVCCDRQHYLRSQKSNHDYIRAYTRKLYTYL